MGAGASSKRKSRARGAPQCLFVGLDGAGKSAIIWRICNASAAPTSASSRPPQLAVACAPSTAMAKHRVAHSLPNRGGSGGGGSGGGGGVILVDMPGRRRFRAAWEGAEAAGNSSAILFVVDSADESRFAQARTELQRIASAKCAAHLPLLVLANKQDLPHAATADEVAKALGCFGSVPVHACSAVDDGLCVPAAMDWVVEHVGQIPGA